MFPFFRLGSEIVYIYPLFLGLLTGLSYNYSKSILQTTNQKFNSFNIFYFGLFLSTWFGAKALYLMTASQEIQEKAMLNQNFWLGGGFVFFGGFIGGLLFVIFYGWKTKKSILEFQFLVPVIVLCHAIGRIGCFLAGCCFGTFTDGPLGIEMHGGERHPVQLYESVSLFALYFFLNNRFKQGRKIFIPYIIGYGVIRFILEFFRGDKIRGIYWGGLSTSQFISIGLILVFSLILFLKREKDA